MSYEQSELDDILDSKINGQFSQLRNQLDRIDATQHDIAVYTLSLNYSFQDYLDLIKYHPQNGY